MFGEFGIFLFAICLGFGDLGIFSGFVWGFGDLGFLCVICLGSWGVFRDSFVLLN